MAAFDAHTNLSYSTVATAPSPATSGTSLVVAVGTGVLFPVAPFNLAIWPVGVQPLTTNCEIVRVTNVSTDTFTIVRNTTTENNNNFNRTILVGDQLSNAITWKMFSDIETAINFKAPAMFIG